MNLIKVIKENLNSIYVKYISKNEEIEEMPIFYIGGSQTLPPPLLPEEEKIPFEEYKKNHTKQEIQMNLPNSNKIQEVKKKKMRQRHHSVIEEPEHKKLQKQRRLSMNRDGKLHSVVKTGLCFEMIPTEHSNDSNTGSYGSDLISPRFSSMSPNTLSMDSPILMNDQNLNEINKVHLLIKENYDYLQIMNDCLLNNIPLNNDLGLLLSIVINKDAISKTAYKIYINLSALCNIMLIKPCATVKKNKTTPYTLMLTSSQLSTRRNTWLPE